MRRYLLELNEDEMKSLVFLLQEANNLYANNTKLTEAQHTRRTDLIAKVASLQPVPMEK
jgi:hypothetical protein